MRHVHSEQLEVGADLMAPRAARRFVARILGAWAAHAQVIERSELLVSELVSNAVQYGEGPITIIIRDADPSSAASPEPQGTQRAAAFRIEVCNSGQGRPVVRHPTADEVSGRGLQIVDELSWSWGSVANDGATSVWFEMRADAAV